MKMQFVDFEPETQRCVLGETNAPAPGPEDILCKVSAFGINRADLLQKQGKYPPPQGASEILGMEFSGEVVGCGQHADNALMGKKLCAMVTGGAYAQYVTLPVNHAMFLAPGQDLISAAAIPEVFLTAYQALFSIAVLKSGQKVLIHAGGSGVGTAAIQLASSAGGDVAVTASSEAKLARCRELGARVTTNYQTQDFAAAMGDAKFFPDVIIDFVGEGHLQKNLSVIATDGKIVQLAMLGGRYISQLDMAKLLAKRVTWQASTLRNRSDEYKAKLVADFLRDFGPQIWQGQIQPVIDTEFAIADINLAHERMAKNDNIGKFIVSW